MKLNNATALFEITNMCNLNCQHCYREILSRNELSLEQIKLIIRKITDYGIKYLILSGGEPFLRKDLFEIIDCAVNNNIQDIAIYTNGILLDNSKIIFEIKNRLDNITSIPISFDGAKSETHDFIRGRGEFLRLMKILENNDLTKLPIGINVTIGKWNFDDLNDFFTIYDKFNAIDINFGIFIPMGKGKQLKDQILTSYQCQSIVEMAKRKKELGYNVELCSLPWSHLFAEALSGHCCNIFIEFITITAQGNIIPCILYDYNCGSILSTELDEIFSNPLVKLFQNPEKLQKHMIGYCRTCPTFKICKGGCKLITYALKGNITQSDLLCPIARHSEKIHNSFL